jgi:signal peptidase I
MRSSALDRRVRKEARILVHEAHQRVPQKPEGLDEAAREVAAALAAGDLARVRHGLPRLDELVAELPRARRSVVAEYAAAIGSLIVIVLGIRAFVLEAFKIPSSSMLPTLEINDHIFVTKFVYGLRVPLVDAKLFARSPDRGEVIVFIQPCEQRDFIKRVVGLAGDRVEVRCNILYVNGKAAPSRYDTVEDCEVSEEIGSRQCARYRESLGGYTYATYYDPERPRRDAEPRPPGDAPHDFPRFTALQTCASPNQRPGTIVVTQQVDAAGPCGQQMHYVVPEDHVFVMGDHRDGSRDSRYWGSVPIENIKGKALFRWLSYRELGWTHMRWGKMGDFVH